MTNIYYLTGFMAAGKSRIGQALSELLGVSFADLDDVIEEQTGLLIPTIFEQQGEQAFRVFEKQYLLRLAQSYQGVLSLGGGALHDQSVVDAIKESGILIFINTPLNVILERLYEDMERPLLRDRSGNLKPKKQIKTELTSLYKDRLPLYKQADLHFTPTVGASIADNGQRLSKQIKKYEQKS